MLEYSGVIDKVMNIGLDRINTNPKMNIDELFRDATDGEERTVRIVIYKDAENGEKPETVFIDPTKVMWDQGLAHQNGKILKINQKEYTVTYKITISAWFRLVSQQNTFKDLYWSDKFDASGKYFARDLVVWGKFWERYKDVVKINALEKLIMKQKDDEK